jgi:hypothetical protein
MTDDWYDQTRQEFMERMRKYDPIAPEPEPEPEPDMEKEEFLKKFKNREFAESMWRSIQFQREMEAWEKEREEKRFPNKRPYAVKEALDTMRDTVTSLEIAMRVGMVSPEALGFTSRKVSNLIKALEALKEKMDNYKRDAQEEKMR